MHTTWSDQLKDRRKLVWLDPGSGQIAVEEGRYGLAGLGDLVVVVVMKAYRTKRRHTEIFKSEMIED